jgi:uncharacterized protein (UPF0335 family)
MSKTIEKEKSLMIKLDTVQFKDLCLTIDFSTGELKKIVDKLERLESAITKIEGELKLIRVENK